MFLAVCDLKVEFSDVSPLFLGIEEHFRSFKLLQEDQRLRICSALARIGSKISDVSISSSFCFSYLLHEIIDQILLCSKKRKLRKPIQKIAKAFRSSKANSVKFEPNNQSKNEVNFVNLTGMIKGAGVRAFQVHVIETN